MKALKEGKGYWCCVSPHVGFFGLCCVAAVVAAELDLLIKDFELTTGYDGPYNNSASSTSSSSNGQSAQVTRRRALQQQQQQQQGQSTAQRQRLAHSDRNGTRLHGKVFKHPKHAPSPHSSPTAAAATVTAAVGGSSGSDDDESSDQPGIWEGVLSKWREWQKQRQQQEKQGGGSRQVQPGHHYQPRTAVMTHHHHQQQQVAAAAGSSEEPRTVVMTQHHHQQQQQGMAAAGSSGEEPGVGPVAVRDESGLAEGKDSSSNSRSSGGSRDGQQGEQPKARRKARRGRQRRERNHAGAAAAALAAVNGSVVDTVPSGNVTGRQQGRRGKLQQQQQMGRAQGRQKSHRSRPITEPMVSHNATKRLLLQQQLGYFRIAAAGGGQRRALGMAEAGATTTADPAAAAAGGGSSSSSVLEGLGPSEGDVDVDPDAVLPSQEVVAQQMIGEGEGLVGGQEYLKKVAAVDAWKVTEGKLGGITGFVGEGHGYRKRGRSGAEVLWSVGG